MPTLQEKLSQTLHAKTDIKNAIIAKGVDVPESTPFSDYPEKIGEIGKPPWIQITETNWYDYINTPFMYSWVSNEEMVITAPTGEYPWIVENAKTLDSFKLEVDLPDESMWFNSFNGERVTGVGKHTLVVNRDQNNANDWSKVSFGWGSTGSEFPSDKQPKVRVWVRVPPEPPGPAVEYVTCLVKNQIESNLKVYCVGENLAFIEHTINPRITKEIKVLKDSLFYCDANYAFVRQVVSGGIKNVAISELYHITGDSSLTVESFDEV